MVVGHCIASPDKIFKVCRMIAYRSIGWCGAPPNTPCACSTAARHRPSRWFVTPWKRAIVVALSCPLPLVCLGLQQPRNATQHHATPRTKARVQPTHSGRRWLLLVGVACEARGEREREPERSVQQRCVTRLLCNYVALRGAPVACHASCSRVAPLAATHTSPAACCSQHAVGGQQRHPGGPPMQSCRASCVCLSVGSLSLAGMHGSRGPSRGNDRCRTVAGEACGCAPCRNVSLLNCSCVCAEPFWQIDQF
jgi:hypothetical protein